ncbi:hypothetical protein LZC95_20250 [Pendulispora brunnea]|uniref:Uncharacterized protein n=1 Tax=Pendulispora brunnea TaxID=2905690 RepID=A0ABZ2KS38_9BACT
MMSMKTSSNKDDSTSAAEPESAAARMQSWFERTAAREEGQGRWDIAERLRGIGQTFAESAGRLPSNGVAAASDRLFRGVFDELRQVAYAAYGSGTDSEEIVSRHWKLLAADFHREFLSQWSPR